MGDVLKFEKTGIATMWGKKERVIRMRRVERGWEPATIADADLYRRAERVVLDGEVLKDRHD